MNHFELMSSLRDRHHEILCLIKGRTVDYMDLPLHTNIGDILIMLGTLKFFDENNIRLKSMSYVGNSFVSDSNFEKHAIVFHGGGNLGDLYISHQKLREKIIGDYKNTRIIILPQTINFENEDNYLKCCQIFSSHPDLHIFVRDENSLRLASKMTKNSYLVPDMAHHLWSDNLNNIKSKGRLKFFRKDIEAKIKDNLDGAMDWDDLTRKFQFQLLLFSIFRKLMKFFGLDKKMPTFISKIWIFLSMKIYKYSIDFFSLYEEIETDRLHGHIFACILNKKSIVHDNSYGKNKSYIDAWTKNSEFVKFYS